ncbi:MAG: hypothetical protein OEL83_10190 [Desulforhopalus sp.]|nr:hypothetical protein [Desulforhopalus sp.]
MRIVKDVGHMFRLSRQALNSALTQSMLVAPATFDVQRHPERNRERVERIKRVVSGEYIPCGLFDIFYGKLDRDTQKNIPPLSCFESYYR